MTPHSITRRSRPMNRLWSIAAALALLGAGCAGPMELSVGWEYTGGPYAQDISSVLPDAFLAGHLYAGLRTGEVYKSTDRGASWNRIALIRKDASVTRLYQDSDVPAKLLAATSQGAFASADGGLTWKELPVTGASSGIGCFALASDPWKPGVLYAGTRGRGAYRSSDGGSTWSALLGGTDASLALTDVHEIVLDPGRPDRLYAAFAGSGLMRSDNAGGSWTPLTSEYAATGTVVTHLVINRRYNDDLLIGTRAGDVFKSTDAGSSWVPVRQGRDRDRIVTLACDPADPEFVLAGTASGLFRSTDFGTSWEQLGESLPRVPAALVQAPLRGDSSMYVFGEGIGLKISYDAGTTWVPADANLGGSTASPVITDRSGKVVFCGVGGTVLRYEDSSKSWIAAGAGLTGDAINALALDAELSSTVYAATPDGVFRSTSLGESWLPPGRRLSIVPKFLDAHPWIPTRLFASSEQGLFVSTDRGNSWGQVKPLGSKFSVRSQTFMPTDAGVIYAIGSTGFLTTTDGGFNWTPSRLGTAADNISGVTLDSTEPNTCYAWISTGEAYRSANRGLEWSRQATPWKPGQSVWVIIDRYDPSNALALVGRTAIYHTRSGGTWKSVGELTMPFDALTLHWNAREQTLYAGTRYNGVFRLKLGPLLEEEDASD